MAPKPTYEQLEKRVQELEQGEVALKRAMETLTDSEKRSFEERELFLNEMGRMVKIGGWEHDLITRKAIWTKGVYDIIEIESGIEPPGVDEHLGFYPPEYQKALVEAYRRTEKGGPPFDLELQVHTATGKRLWCRVHGEAVMEGGKCIKMRGVFQDITKRRKMEQELARARRLESMGILAGGLAHDYNNLLSMILGNISLAKDEIGPCGRMTGFLDDAEEATLKAKDLTHRLMTLSKGSGAYKKLRSVQDSLEICAGEIPRFSNCVCNIKIEKDLWPAEHDSGQLKYAIRNVLKNGVEAMPDGGALSLKAENVVVQRGHGVSGLPGNSGEYLKVSISDHGRGIRKADLAKIFDPYFSTKEMGARKGMGLGLAIAHAIVDKHDGHIAVNSELETGTTVQIYLPARSKSRVRAAEHPQIEKKSSHSAKFSKPSVQAGAGEPLRSKRILVMDDEEMLRQLAEHMLKRLGYEAVSVKDGNEAIHQYERGMESGEPFDVVILDLTVKGGMGGREAVKALIRMDPQVRAIVSSGYFNDPVLTSYENYGFCGAMPKPYQKNDLERVLAKVLNL
jgi:two-component system, cell cycle sensor histidine kinase and response regulator CckA